MNDKPQLDNRQLEAITTNGRALDALEKQLPEETADRLIAFQERVGNAWVNRAPHPFVHEAQEVFGAAYLGLPGEAKTSMQKIMNDIGLNPSVPLNSKSRVQGL